MRGFMEIPAGGRYRLAGARAPSCLLEGVALPERPDGLCDLDLLVADGRIEAITSPGALEPPDLPAARLGGGLVMPAFVDLHTHLDKGHIWPRAANPDGTFAGALAAVPVDRIARWSAADLRRRMEFSLRCAYAHGTRAIRTHLDSMGGQEAITWPLFDELRTAWAGRIDLQAVSLFGIEQVAEPEALAKMVAAVVRHGGLLGAVVYPQPGLDGLVDRLFAVAAAFDLALDLHVDETGDPGAQGLRLVAEATLRHGRKGRVTAGHCCALAAQEPGEAGRTLDLVAEAGMTVVSLPLCNLYLQGREAGRTPRWRGLTLVHEMRARGIPVCFASDNTRDPFYAYGDLDMLEVLREATRIGHLDHPLGDWPRAVTRTPAAAMGLEGAGRLAPGDAADLVLFRGRSWGELLARPEAERVVLRGGVAIERSLPDYAELDDLMETTA